jgi:tetratricopeptide (TPR) repeat protein
MVRSYPRAPAFLVLMVISAVAILYLRNAADVETAGEISGESIEMLELRLAAGEESAPLWFAYAQRLDEAGRHEAAAAAYAQVLQSEPYHREARFGRAMALAHSAQSDPFFLYMHDLVYSEPRLAVDVLERREVRAYLSEPRFRDLSREAQIQALD